MEELYKTKVLFERTRKNQIQYWQGVVKTDGSKTYYVTNSWVEGGKKVKSSGLVEVEPKNVGKANETSQLDQAISEVTSKMNKKIDKGYEYVDGTPIERNPFIYPMRALPLPEVGEVKFPLYMQYKYDGIRCMHDGTRFWSRNLKEFVWFDHLKLDTDGYVVDGEVMLPPPYVFNDTVSVVRTSKVRHELMDQVGYYLYDIVDDKSHPKMPYSERLELLRSLSLPPNVYIAPTKLVNSEEERKQFHDEAVSLGYEGSIGRVPSAKYLIKYQSKELIKFKDFVSEEFEIIGYEEGNGNHKGCIVFICKTSEGVVFRATPKAPLEYRRKWLLDAQNLIGKMVTVEFQAYSETRKYSPDGSLRFPRAIEIRDYE